MKCNLRRKAIAFIFVLTALINSVPIRALAQEPIKIGVLYSLSGTFPVMGNGAATAAQLAFDEEGATIAGRRFQIILDDDEGKADVSLQKLKKLVEYEKVDVLLASFLSNVSLANRDYLHEEKIPTLTLGGSAALTREKKSPAYFRVAPSSFQWGTASAKYLIEKKNWKKIVLIGSNYLAPREGLGAAAKVYGTDGVVETLWPPFGVLDYAPFLSKLAGVNADGAIVAVWGSDALKFLPQYSDYGLDKRIPIFGAASFATEEYLQGMPNEVDGVLSLRDFG
jgi:branched-chain amino acid transport system substrate-binding protein